jgi:hypothetical protein
MLLNNFQPLFSIVVTRLYLVLIENTADPFRTVIHYNQLSASSSTLAGIAHVLILPCGDRLPQNSSTMTFAQQVVVQTSLVQIRQLWKHFFVVPSYPAVPLGMVAVH